MPVYDVAVPIKGELWLRVRAETEHAAKVAAANATRLFDYESYPLGERFRQMAAEDLPGFAGANTLLFLNDVTPPETERIAIQGTLPDPPSP